MENHENLISQIKTLIGTNKTEKALELLANTQLSSLDKEFLILNSRYTKVKEDQRMGILDEDTIQRKLNKINLDLLHLAERIGKTSHTLLSARPSGKSEKKFNIWLAIIPLIFIVGGIGLFKSMNSDDISKDIVPSVKTPITKVNPSKETPTKINGPIRIKDDRRFGLTVYYQKFNNNSQIILHEGFNEWKMLSSGAIVLKENPKFGLTVKDQKIDNNSKIVLHENYNLWEVLSNGAIVLKDNPRFGLTPYYQKINNNTEIILHSGYNMWN